MFGIDMKTIIPQAEKMLAGEWQKWETEAGCRLIAVAERTENGTFEVALFKDDTTGNLTIWRKFDLADLADFLNNPEKNTENVQQFALGERTAGANQPGTNNDNARTGTGAVPGFDEHPAFH